ncbi:MAG: SpoVR family protein, partial [Fibrobacteria bacterium]
DMMGFIMKHSPREFEEWELDVLSVIRDQSIYFMPQRKTKVMNEGWASFWHMRIMSRLFQDGFLTPEEHGFYNLYNARVLASNPFGLNPYLLGIKTFLNIEKRYNAGQFGPEWERSESPDKWNLDLDVGKGMEKVFEVRRTHMDWFFLDEFMNRQVVEESELYIFGSKQQGNVEEFTVEETNWSTIKELVVRSFAHSGVPLIKVNDGDYGGKRELYLRHFYDGLTLEEEYARQTLRHVFSLWDRPVHLETVEVEGNSETRIQLTYDGKGFSKINLGSFLKE